MLAPGPVPAADEADVSVHTVFHDGDASTVKDGGQSGDSAGDLLSQKKVEDTLAASPSPNHASRKRQVFWEVLVVSALFVTYVRWFPCSPLLARLLACLLACLLQRQGSELGPVWRRCLPTFRETTYLWLKKSSWLTQTCLAGSSGS